MSRLATSAVLALAALTTVGGPAVGEVAVPVPPDKLAATAPIVVVADVDWVRSGVDRLDGAAATFVGLAVERVVRGPELHTVVLREAGLRTRAGQERLEWGGADYLPGERVLVYLEVGAGGLLRTWQHRFGKMRLESDGDEQILARRSARESWPLDALLRQVERAPDDRIRPLRPFRTAPAEVDWLEPVRGLEFTVGELTSRWPESDLGVPIPFDLERAGNPLGDGAETVARVQVALDAWNAVVEARVEVFLRDDDADYVALHPISPRFIPPFDEAPPFGIVLFGDPYDDIDPPIDCTGTQALSGITRETASPTEVNGVEFFATRYAYVIFADGWDTESCDVLTDPLLLEELAAHEIGHTLGLGHSLVDDALMREEPYGDRGARLGLDDADGLHCFYPHQLDIDTPTDGQSFVPGGRLDLRWTTSADAGAAGTVDVLLSTDDGQSWQELELDQPNTGLFSWIVPELEGPTVRLALERPLALQPPPAPFPTACTRDETGSLALTTVMGPTGEVPDGLFLPGMPMTASQLDGSVLLEWDASCGSVTGYAVYSGSLEELRAGVWNPTPVDCASASTSATVAPTSNATFYLISPVQGGLEGTFGSDSDGQPRPPASADCGVQDPAECE